MSKYIKDVLMIILAFIGCSLVIVLLLLAGLTNQYETNYVSAMRDKLDRLDSISGKKIVLVGDSNLVFGMNSEKLEEASGYSVVNMGLHGGLGNDLQMKLAFSNVQEGDIYVVSFTNYNQDYYIYQKDLTMLMLAKNWDMWKLLSFRQLLEIIPAIPDYLFNSYSLMISGRGNQELEACYLDYARSSFNPYGDMGIRIEENDFFDFANYSSCVSGISDRMIDELKFWNEYCGARGAKVVIAGYPIAKTGSCSSEEDFSAFGYTIEKCSGCQCVSDFKDYIFPLDLFYDTQFHLTTEGADYRTSLLINDLKAIEVVD